MVRMESEMSSTLSVRSVVASAFYVLDRYTSERFGRLRSTRGEGASGVSPVQNCHIWRPYCLIQMTRDGHYSSAPERTDSTFPNDLKQ
jgi:hypothetical protein